MPSRRRCTAVARAVFPALAAFAAFAAFVPRAAAQSPGDGARASAEDASKAMEYLLVVRNGSLWRVAIPPYERKRWKPAPRTESAPPPIELVRLAARSPSQEVGAAPEGAPDAPARPAITRVALFATGRLAVIETTDGVAFAELPAPGAVAGDGATAAPGAPKTATSVPCVGPAHLSPDGRCIVCRDQRGAIMLHRLLPTLKSTALSTTSSRHLGFLDSRHLVVTDDRGVWSQSILRPSERSLLASEVPDGPMLVSPDGKRAVGVFHEDAGKTSNTPGGGDSEAEPKKALHVFRLDGKGVKRRLLEGAVPVGWSRDSRWLMAQLGTRACMVRATGGQYKCWRGYRAIALAPDGTTMLLARPADDKSETDPDRQDLYRGHREGVRPEKPRLVMDAVTGPATWLVPAE